LADVSSAASGLRCGLLSLFFWMSVKEIFRLGINFPFPRPERCLKDGCGGRVWGHGFVERYFDGFGKALFLRRWRCPDCGTIYTIRPHGFWSRHHAPIQTVCRSLCHRLRHGTWDRSLGLSRQRQNHWFQALKKNILSRLGMSFRRRILRGFHELVPLITIPVVRSR
jgi:hypothetical protein